MTEVQTIHRFERAGLGKAPYQLVGVRENIYSACPGHQQPGGTCDYCSTGILYEYWLRSADGKEFKVGSDCIMKSDDSGLIRIAQREESKRRTEATHARQDAKIGAARAKLPAVRGTLASKPHPNQWQADKGATLLDYVEWMLRNAGRSGKCQAAGIIEREHKGVSQCN